MQKIGLFTLLLVLAGCTTSGNGSMPVLGSADSSVSLNAGKNTLTPEYENVAVDVDEINAAIAADRQRYWAPEEEILQQAMSEDI